MSIPMTICCCSWGLTARPGVKLKNIAFPLVGAKESPLAAASQQSQPMGTPVDLHYAAAIIWRDLPFKSE